MPKEGFKDTLHVTQTVKLSIWMRLVILFSPTIKFEQIIYCKDIMPGHECETGKLITRSYLDELKWKWFQSKYHVMSSEPVKINEEDVKKQNLRKKLDSLIKKKWYHI